MRNLFLVVVLMGTFLIQTPDGWEFQFDQNKFAVDPGMPDGMGLPPIQHSTQILFKQPGQLLQDISIQPRIVTITAKLNGECLAELHALRCKLWNALRWNRTTDDPPLPANLIYREECGDTILHCYYLGDATEDVGADESVQATGIRLVAYDPLWYAPDEQSDSLAISQSLNVSYIAGKIAGIWSAMGNPGTERIRAMALSKDGNTLYIGGFFLNWNGIANADYIAKYTISTGVWSAVGTGMDNYVYALAVAPNGDLYAAGDFTNAGGGAANRIAKWNGAAWSALGTGLNGVGYALAIASNGDLYVGGSFTTAGGGGANRIAKWSGGAWSALSTGMNADVNALTIDPTGILYTGGSFTTAGGTTVNYIAKWNGTAWAAMAGGMSLNGFVTALVISPAGDLYAGGVFTTAGGVAAIHVARWNGVAWFPVGAGLGIAGVGQVFSMGFASDGTLYAGGSFVLSGSDPLADRVAQFSGGIWSHLDIDLPGTPNVYALAISGTDLFFGFDTSGVAVASSISNTVNNAGDFEAFPTFVVTGPGTLEWIDNATTHKRIVFNLPINAGETVTVNLTAKTIRSDWRGDLLRYAALLPLSDFASFSLAPHPIAPDGDNSITIMVINSTGATTAVIKHTNRWLSADCAVMCDTYLPLIGVAP